MKLGRPLQKGLEDAAAERWLAESYLQATTWLKHMQVMLRNQRPLLRPCARPSSDARGLSIRIPG